MKKDKKVKENISKITNKLSEELFIDNEKIKKTIEKNYFYIFVKVFFTNLKDNKLYLMSFIITVAFLGIVSVNKVKESEGFYNPSDSVSSDKVEKEEKPVQQPVVKEPVSNNKDSDKVDFSDYVGIYSREVKLDNKMEFDGSCSIEGYKLIYQIKSDGKITKYISLDCAGTYVIWEDELGYVTSSGAKYISANNVNFLFNNGLREVDGDNYGIDDTITSIKENMKIDSLKLYFYDSNIIFMTFNNLYLVKGNMVDFDLNKKYPNNGGKKDTQRVVKTSSDEFKFIVFNNEDDDNCYTDSDSEEDNYTIYSITYDKNGKFDEEKKIVTRSKKDGCEVFDQDMKEMGLK